MALVSGCVRAARKSAMVLASAERAMVDGEVACVYEMKRCDLQCYPQNWMVWMVACVSMGSRHFGQQNVGIAVRHWVMSLHRPPDKGSPL
jgi:hypothetical protein